MTTLIKADVTPLPIDLGKKEIIINPVGSLVDSANELQIEILEAIEPTDNSKPIEIFKMQKKMSDDVKDFLKQVLSLSNAQYKKINETWTKEQINSYVSYLLTLIQGIPVKSFEDFMKDSKEDSEDPKGEDTELEN